MALDKEPSGSPMLVFLAWEARPVRAALCDPTSLNSCRGHRGETSEKTLPGVSDYIHPELLPSELPSWPCPSAQQGPGTTGAFRNTGEMSLSSLKTYTASSGRSASEALLFPALASAHSPLPQHQPTAGLPLVNKASSPPQSLKNS